MYYLPGQHKEIKLKVQIWFARAMVIGFFIGVASTWIYKEHDFSNRYREILSREEKKEASLKEARDELGMMQGCLTATFGKHAVTILQAYKAKSSPVEPRQINQAAPGREKKKKEG